MAFSINNIKYDDVRFPWSEWQRTFVFLPHKTITEKCIIGFAWRRTRLGWSLDEDPDKLGYQIIYTAEIAQYASKMELFKVMLKGEANDNTRN